LYDIVGTGMWAVTRARFDVQVLGDPIPRVERGQLWVATHRAETDVPLIGGLLMIPGGMWRPGATARVHFAARDDLFEPGVVSAGLHLPGPLARLAWPLTPGPWLPRVRAHPIRRPTGLKLSQALDGLEATLPLVDVLMPDAIERLAQRAAAVGRRPPETVGQARDATFAQQLWRDVTIADLDTPIGRGVWRTHVARAAGDVRRLIDLVRRGEPMVVFPEGRVSPAGGIGPVGDVLDLIVRRGAPTAVLPVGIAYDPLRRGRATVAVSVGPPLTASEGPVGPLVLDRLRRATPITVGQVVAREVTAVAASAGTTLAMRHLLARLAHAHDVARHERRPFVRGLSSPGRRARSGANALHVLQAKGLVEVLGAGQARVDPDRVFRDPVLSRLAAEDLAVWDTDHGRP
jgi:1-acyl-sn-glycerol-3-phosphate acyltransferase